MKSRHFIVVGLACLALAGCRTDPNIALLERELRLQEDEIYRLRACVEDYQATLETYQQRAGGADTESSTPNGRPSRGILGAAAPTQAPTGPTIPPRAEITPGEEISPDEFLRKQRQDDRSEPSEPRPNPSEMDLQIRIPSADEDRDNTDAPAPRPVRPVGPQDKPAQDTSDPETGRTEPIRPGDSSEVAAVSLNRQRTGGYESDGRPGDDGIAAVVEVQDAEGRRLHAPAAVSVAVIDPAVDGAAARVARWDFTAEDIAQMSRAQDRGIRLRMPWPADPPAHSDLRLFVRYTTSDGRNLQADEAIRVELVSGRMAGWVRSEQSARPRQANPPGEPRQLEPSPQVRVPSQPSARTAARATERTSPATAQEPQRPVWSPDRRYE
ncbi:MAG: hypothetical protein A2V70_07100 [Planctomycetes bacterium RBG_13_63_9]|nr:MAG: hypothetical protein A2V70_07100 [Planctomycetes bacterium RBG_13_63_9]